MTSRLDVAGCGSMVVDLFYRTPRIIRADEKILLARNAMEPPVAGGVVLNHLGWARVLGLATGIFGKIGDDPHGALLVRAMDRLGIRHHLTRDGSASAFALILLDQAGDRAIYMARGATAELRPAEISERHGSFIRQARMVSTEISQLPLATVIAILRFARRHAITTVLDVDVPPAAACPALGTPTQLQTALALATILKPAKAAAEALTGGARDVLQMAITLRQRYGSRAVVITDGVRGAAISATDTALRVPAFRVRQRDSTGAGDAFLGGMLVGLSRGLPWPEVGRLANAAGAICVTRLGAFPSGPAEGARILKLHGRSLAATAPRADRNSRRRSGRSGRTPTG